MNDSRDNAKPLPPDDFSATTPNIKMPKKDLPNFQNNSANDWEKTNYNYSAKDLGAESWKKPAYDVPPAQNPPQDFGKTMIPNQSSGNQPSKGDEWGMTQANINLPVHNQPNPYDQQPDQDYGSKQAEYGATTPFINLPESQRSKYQVPPASTSSPAQASAAAANVSFPNINIADEEEKKESKTGIPSWLWAGGGMLLMFFFAVAVLLGVYFLFLGKKGFEVKLRNISKESEVYINGSSWGVSSADDTVRLQGLRAKESKLIHVVDPTRGACKDETVTGEDGDLKEIIVSCEKKTGGGVTTGPGKTDPIPDGCKDFKNGDFNAAAKCANDALDKLGETFTAQQLLDAMNIYIVNFASNDDKIKPSDLAFLQKSSGYIKRLEKLEPGTKIEVGGHTDNVGTDAKNQPLSERRAKSVYDSLLGFGVNKDMLTTFGYGSKKPKPGNENRNPDEKFRNRRIEYRKV